jgi:hypothetical protein
MKTICRRRACCRRYLIAWTVLTFAVYACAAGPTLVGRWKAVDGSATVYFSPDGEFHAVDNEGMPVSGTYRLVGPDGIRFEIRHDGSDTERIDARLTRAGDRLTLTFPGENAIDTYGRIP